MSMDIASAPFWNYLFNALNLVGAFAVGWAVFITMISWVWKGFKVLPSPRLLAVCRLLAPRPVVVLLVVGGVHLLLALCALAPDRPFYPWAILLLAIPYGGLFYLGMSGKGVGMPLGHGLKLTIERSPQLNVPLSPLVLCFHVDGDFRKNREAITELIIEAINATRAFSADYDFVLKSWFFANRDEDKEPRILTVRRYMGQVGNVALACIVGHLLVFVGYFACPGLAVGWVLLGAASVMSVAVLLIAPRLRSAVKVMRKISPEDGSWPAETSARVLGKAILRDTRGYGVKFIPRRPMSRTHFLGLGLAGLKVRNSCGGAEAGLLLVRRPPLIAADDCLERWGGVRIPRTARYLVREAQENSPTAQ